jgi:hypothetical protein
MPFMRLLPDSESEDGGKVLAQKPYTSSSYIKGDAHAVPFPVPPVVFGQLIATPALKK